MLTGRIPWNCRGVLSSGLSLDGDGLGDFQTRKWYPRIRGNRADVFVEFLELLCFESEIFCSLEV